jgi:hypothetical protein
MAIRSGSLGLFGRAGPAGAVAGHHTCLSKVSMAEVVLHRGASGIRWRRCRLLSLAGVPSQCMGVRRCSGPSASGWTAKAMGV